MASFFYGLKRGRNTHLLGLTAFVYLRIIDRRTSKS
jgi:hypothetical protein